MQSVHGEMDDLFGEWCWIHTWNGKLGEPQEEIPFVAHSSVPREISFNFGACTWKIHLLAYRKCSRPSDVGSLSVVTGPTWCSWHSFDLTSCRLYIFLSAVSVETLCRFAKNNCEMCGADTCMTQSLFDVCRTATLSVSRQPSVRAAPVPARSWLLFLRCVLFVLCLLWLLSDNYFSPQSAHKIHLPIF